ncbi:hypothetical protein [Nocardioides sp. 616]|uniref:hypothetical protein n=1 Tax=Nocardioides sp. 616 TaxID=2268090 RepID=UPI0013B36914|nr:hypothetical protein [Nocardioides sp. 616]
MSEQMVPAVIGAAALVVCALVVTLVRLRTSTRTALAAALREQQELRARLELLERTGPAAPAGEQPHEFVITEVGGTPGPAEPAPVPSRIEGRLFADIVLREGVVKVASLAHGVRRALAPEQRNRIRFEVRRETRRAGRRRKADVKEALRQYYAREPGDVA